jgi:uncharacterized protein YndB with AHSA1/START domain
MSRASADEPALVITRIVPAPPRAVFEAWLDPRALSAFMCPAQGTRVSKAEVDPRVGGKFLILMNIGGKDLPHHGEYLAIEPYERLVFTWLSHHAGPGSEVTLRFEPLGTGETKLTLTHVGLGDATARANHEQGWTRILDALAGMSWPDA